MVIMSRVVRRKTTSVPSMVLEAITVATVLTLRIRLE